MKLGSSSWSFHRTFEAGKMDQFGWVDFCAKELQLDGVELLDAHFPNTKPPYLKDLKKYIIDSGLTISCVSVSNHFTGRSSHKAFEDVDKVKKWVDIAESMGAPILRVFAGSGEELKDPAIHEQAVQCLQRSAIYAEHVGIALGLENHGGTSARQVLALVKDVNSSWLKLTLDTGNFPSAPYKSIEQCLPHAVIVHAKLYELDKDGAEKRLNYKTIMRVLRKQKYVGFLSIEFEGASDELKFMPRGVKFLRQLMAEPFAQKKRKTPPKSKTAKKK